MFTDTNLLYFPFCCLPFPICLRSICSSEDQGYVYHFLSLTLIYIQLFMLVWGIQWGLALIIIPTRANFPQNYFQILKSHWLVVLWSYTSLQYEWGCVSASWSCFSLNAASCTNSKLLFVTVLCVHVLWKTHRLNISIWDF
jgi:hypothetical protein